MDREEARELLLGYSRFINEETDLWEALDLAIQALERMIEGAKEINKFLEEATAPKEMTLEEWQELDREIQGDAESATTTEDCISRQAVIDLLLNAQDGSGQTYEVIRELLHEVAYMPPVNQKQITSKLESAEVATSEGEESTMGQPKSKLDCISRQQAIEAVKNICNTPCNEYFVKAIESLPPVTPTERIGEWIPTSERLPKAEDMYQPPEQRYLCQLEAYGERKFCVLSRLKGAVSPFWDWYGVAVHDYEVTAWMPLPEPYKAESEDKDVFNT